MKIKVPFSVLWGIALLGGSAVAASFAYSDSELSRIKVQKNANGQVVEDVHLASYEVARDYDGESASPVLLKKVTDVEQVEGLEGSTGHLTLSARASNHDAYDTLLYTKSEAAHDAAYAGDGLLLTWLFGCCDSTTGYRAYNLRTGKLLFSYDDQTGVSTGNFTAPFVVEVPNTKLKRYVGLLTADATRDFKPSTVDTMQKIATIRYASADGSPEGLDLFMKIPENVGVRTSAEIVDVSATRINEIRANRITLWTSDGVNNPAEAFRGFGVKVTVYSTETTTFTIPFSGDHFDLSATPVPEGFRLVPIH